VLTVAVWVILGKAATACAVTLTLAATPNAMFNIVFLTLKIIYLSLDEKILVIRCAFPRALFLTTVAVCAKPTVAASLKLGMRYVLLVTRTSGKDPGTAALLAAESELA